MKRKRQKKKMLAVGSRFFFVLSQRLLLSISPLTKSNHAHLKRPHSANPHLELAFDAFNIVQLDTLPPAASSGFSPEEEQLLRHSDGIAAHFVASNVTA